MPSATESKRISTGSADDGYQVAEKFQNLVPQAAPGASAAVGHTLENSIPLSIFPIAVDKFCICFCGLPGRGKTHISRRLARYLSFFHAMPVETFNVGEYRRQQITGSQKMNTASFFDPSDKQAMDQVDETYELAYDGIVEFLSKNTSAVAIMDATNYSHERRTKLLQVVRRSD
jgi:signal recognition particle GTPase